LFLFAFRFRDPLSRKWIKARYVADRVEIASRYAEWEIVGALSYGDRKAGRSVRGGLADAKESPGRVIGTRRAALVPRVTALCAGTEQLT